MSAVVERRCPVSMCGGQMWFPADQDLEGALVVCPTCTTVLVCQDGVFGELDEAGRAEIMSDSSVIDAMLEARMFAEHRREDLARIVAVLTGPVGGMRDQAIASNVAKYLLHLGFHTHPDGGDVPFTQAGEIKP